jgi:hypothetical protein
MVDFPLSAALSFREFCQRTRVHRKNSVKVFQHFTLRDVEFHTAAGVTPTDRSTNRQNGGEIS